MTLSRRVFVVPRDIDVCRLVLAVLCVSVTTPRSLAQVAPPRHMRRHRVTPVRHTRPPHPPATPDHCTRPPHPTAMPSPSPVPHTLVSQRFVIRRPNADCDSVQTSFLHAHQLAPAKTTNETDGVVQESENDRHVIEWAWVNINMSPTTYVINEVKTASVPTEYTHKSRVLHSRCNR